MSTKQRLNLPFPGIRWRGLTWQLFTFIVVPLAILLLVISFGGITLHNEAMRNLVGERDERAARTAARALEEQLNHRFTVVRSLASQGAADPTGTNLESILETSQFILSDFEHGLAYFTPEGNLQVASNNSELWTTLETLSDPVVNQLFNSDSAQSFSYYQNPTNGETLMLVAASEAESGPIAIGAFSPGYLTHRVLADVFSPAESAFAALINQDQELLYSIGDFPQKNNPADHPGVLEALDGESGATYIQIDGSEHVIAYSPVPQAGWALVIDEPWETVANPFLQTTSNAPLILVPGFIIAIVALWFGARQVVQPLQELEGQAASLAWGDFEAINDPVGGIEEIQRLQLTLSHLARKVQNAQEGLKGYIGAITTGQEEERNRLARELHDGTIQSLIALNQRVHLARASENYEPAAQHLAEIQALTHQTIQDLRRITRALRPLYLEDLGLVAALEMLAQETSAALGIPVGFDCQGVERRLSADIELAFYRMAQEGLSNIARHAQAKEASVSLDFDPEKIILSITDDGQGFQVPDSPAEFSPLGHYGLLGLHERAELLGAELKIQSEPRQGTQLTIRLVITEQTI